MSFPRYPKYKDSGVEWLGEVPEHWDVSRLGFESWVRARLGWKGLKAEEYVDEGFAFLSTPNIKGLNIDFENVNFINRQRFEESPEIIVREGDVLLAKDGSTLGTVNVVRRLPRPTTVNSSIAVITPNTNLNSIFLYYLFASSYIEQTIQCTKGGMGVPHLFQADLNKFYLPLPSGKEQNRIAEFLDQETAKIDGLVAEQQRLMELLKEKRQAVISHAVTKGLNPYARMKASGIEWLGDVPEHWNVAALRYFATFSTGSTPSREIERYWNGGIPWVKTGEVNYATIKTTEETISEEGLASCAVSVEPPGTLLMALYGQGVTRGRVALLGIHATFNQACVAIRPDARIDAAFLRAFFIFAYSFIRQSGNETTQMNLSAEYVRGIRIPIPPLEEQKAIAAFLDKETARFDTLAAEAQRAIDLLQERRTALISAAVTGQIDVRPLLKKEAA